MVEAMACIFSVVVCADMVSEREAVADSGKNRPTEPRKILFRMASNQSAAYPPWASSQVIIVQAKIGPTILMAKNEAHKSKPSPNRRLTKNHSH